MDRTRAFTMVKDAGGVWQCQYDETDDLKI